MNSFLPFQDFKASAECLDNKRLGKQRVECFQMLSVLVYPLEAKTYLPLSKLYTWVPILQEEALRYKETRPRAWSNHPAVRMWRGYEETLFDYLTHCCHEWVIRGYQDNVLSNAADLYATFQALHGKELRILYPPWLGDNRLHSSHRAALKLKYPTWYNKYGWEETPQMNYWWPV